MFGVGGRGLGAIMRECVRVCLAGSGRYLECTVGANKEGRRGGVVVSCLKKLAW